MGNGNLPGGWTWTTVGELADRVTKGSTPTSYGFKYQQQGISFVKTENIVENGTIQRITDFIDDETNRFLSRSVLQPYDILFSIAGTIGRVGIVQDKDLPANTNQALAILRGIHARANYKYVFYFLKSPFIQKQALDSIVGVGRANLSLANVSGFQIPLPPLSEQERIVAKIEELFTQLEAGTAALKRVQAGLKRYKASVLKAAVEGRLLNDEFRMQNDELPDGWQLVKFGEIITILKNGFFYGRPSTEPIGIPILRISAVRPMSVNFDEPRYIPDVNEKDVEDYFLTKGDLLFTRYNGNKELVGACGLVGELQQNVLYPDKLIRVRVNEQVVSPEYAQVYFATQTARRHIENRIKSTAGQHGIAGGDVKSIPFILPPLAEQRRIVAEVERRLSVVKEVESVVAASVARAARLRQSVLKSAFEGKLS